MCQLTDNIIFNYRLLELVTRIIRMIAQVSYELIAIIYVISKVSENSHLVLKICLTLGKYINSTCAKFQENRNTPGTGTEPRVRVTCSILTHFVRIVLNPRGAGPDCSRASFSRPITTRKSPKNTRFGKRMAKRRFRKISRIVSL